MSKSKSANNLPTWQRFGEDLLDTYDLDPIYPMVAGAGLDDDAMKRWLLAYWCFYNAGVSCKLAEIKLGYYTLFETAIKDGWPRGMERRYFWGKNALDTLQGLKQFGSPEQVVDAMTFHEDYHSISKAVQSFVGFGPWISWKVADMAERVMCRNVDFSRANLFMYRDPVMGAAYILTGDKYYKITQDELNGVVNRMLKHFRHHLAPPFLDRVVNVQEIETILCKYKAHCFGHYPWGNDTIHVRNALHGWGDLAQHMEAVLNEYTAYQEIAK